MQNRFEFVVDHKGRGELRVERPDGAQLTYSRQLDSRIVGIEAEFERVWCRTPQEAGDLAAELWGHGVTQAWPDSYAIGFGA